MNEATTRFLLTRLPDLPANISQPQIREIALPYLSGDPVDAAVEHWSHLLSISGNVPGNLLCITPMPELAKALLEEFTESKCKILTSASRDQVSGKSKPNASVTFETIENLNVSTNENGRRLKFDTLIIDSFISYDSMKQRDVIDQLSSIMSPGALLVVGCQNGVRLENVWRLVNGTSNDSNDVLAYSLSTSVPELNIKELSQELQRNDFSILDSFTTDITKNETTGVDRLAIVLMHREHTLGQMLYIAARRN